MTEQQKTQAETELPKPKGWVRWSGLIAFLAIVGAVFAITYLGIVLLLKEQLEEFASDAWGAKVEIGSLDLGLLPIRIGLSGLQVTDPDQPMQNMVEVDQIGASLSFYHLVVGRTVIEDLTVMGLAFNQPRKTSGALPKKPKTQTEKTAEVEKKSEANLIEIPKMAIPDATEILTRSNLQTLKAAEDIQKELAEVEKSWNSLQKQIPSSKELKSYEKRFSQLSKGKIKSLDDVQAKQKEFEKLQKEVEQKYAALDKAQKLMRKKLPKLQKQVKGLQKLPAKDFKRLQQTYSLDGQGFSNLTYLLYGPKIQSYLDEGMMWYEKARPFIEKVQQKMAESEAEKLEKKQKRAMGTDVAFEEYDPQPDFMIKRVRLSADIDWGKLLIEVKCLNFNQAESKIPVTFTAELQPVGQQSALQVVGESNFVDPQKGFHQADFNWSGYDIKNWSLLKDDNMPILMKQAQADVAGQILIRNQDQLKGKVDLAYRNVDFDISGSKSKDVKRYVKPVFDDISQFKVTSDFKGSLTSPKIGVKSDLDKMLSSAFRKALDKEIALQKANLKKEFDKLIARELEPINKQLKGLLVDQVKLNKDAKGIDKIVSMDAGKFAEQQKKKYQKQLEKEASKKAEKEVEKLLKGFGF